MSPWSIEYDPVKGVLHPFPYAPIMGGARPFILLDAKKGLTFNGSGADLIDEDFTVDPGWTEFGDSSVVNGKIVSNTVAGVDAYSVKTFAAQTELWAEAIISFDSFSFGATHSAGVFALHSLSGIRVEIYLVESSGIKFAAGYADDAGANDATLSSPVPVLGKKYKITLHYKQATTTSSNDGICEIWIDTIKVLDEQTVDNNAEDGDHIEVGGNLASSQASVLQRTDDVKVGTTGASPAQVTNWADQSGDGNNVPQATAVDQPDWNVSDSDFNGNPSVEADGVSESLKSALFSGGDKAQPNLVFIVHKTVSNVAASDYLFDGHTNAAKRHAIFDGSGGPNQEIFAGTSQALSLIDLNAHVSAYLFNGASSNSWEDGVPTIPAGTIGANPWDGITLFSRFNGANWGNRKVAYLLAYNSNFSDAAINYIGNVLAARFGTTWTDI
ncbi:hypothetical protein LCGC14_0725550 [marine sediment metagenome]|uniref:Uncharacterized protein n=1 Tax=marine sediment metagenome TaxID=412755 RepID=A0A0F9QFA9_9ZZZZ